MILRPLLATEEGIETCHTYSLNKRSDKSQYLCKFIKTNGNIPKNNLKPSVNSWQITYVQHSSPMAVVEIPTAAMPPPIYIFHIIQVLSKMY